MIESITVPALKFRIRLTHNPGGVLTVECVDLPGCVSQGSTKSEALRNIREAILAWMEAEAVARRKGWKPARERRPA